jgi:hypothetical protein
MYSTLSPAGNTFFIGFNSTGVLLLRFAYNFHKIVYYIPEFHAFRAIHFGATVLSLACRIFRRRTHLMVSETGPNSNFPVTLVAGNWNTFERALRTSHAFATRLVTYVRNVSPTPFVTHFTHVPFSHSTRQFRDHVLMSFDFIVK